MMDSRTQEVVRMAVIDKIKHFVERREHKIICIPYQLDNNRSAFTKGTIDGNSLDDLQVGQVYKTKGEFIAYCYNTKLMKYVSIRISDLNLTNCAEILRRIQDQTDSGRA